MQGQCHVEYLSYIPHPPPVNSKKILALEVGCLPQPVLRCVARGLLIKLVFKASYLIYIRLMIVSPLNTPHKEHTSPHGTHTRTSYFLLVLLGLLCNMFFNFHVLPRHNSSPCHPCIMLRQLFLPHGFLHINL